jgi:hypothetical protein
MESFERLPEDLDGKVTILSYIPVFNGTYSHVYRGEMRETGELVCLSEAFLTVRRMNAFQGGNQSSQRRRWCRPLYHAKSKSVAYCEHSALLNQMHRK